MYHVEKDHCTERFPSIDFQPINLCSLLNGKQSISTIFCAHTNIAPEKFYAHDQLVPSKRRG